MNSSAYLIKSAVLYNPAKPNMNWQLGLQSARKAGVPVLHTDSWNPLKYLGGKILRANALVSPKLIGIDTGLKKSFPAQGKVAPISIDMRLPGAKGEMLTHELNEISTTPSAGEIKRVANISPSDFAAIKSTQSKPLAKKLFAEGGVAHNEPSVLLNEAHRAASGQISPETTQQLIHLRKATGEFQALKRLGVNYATTLLPENGRAYRKALAKFNHTNLMGPHFIHSAPRLWSTHPKAVSNALKSYREWTA